MEPEKSGVAGHGVGDNKIVGHGQNAVGQRRPAVCGHAAVGLERVVVACSPSRPTDNHVAAHDADVKIYWQGKHRPKIRRIYIATKRSK